MLTTRSLRHRGQSCSIEADEALTLLDVVRDFLDVRSASRGCENGSCGACRVLVDGAIVNACVVAFGAVRDGAVIETYEDLMAEPAAARAVRAFEVERPTRCSLCIGGLGVTAVALDRAGRAGDPEAVETSLATATCMCTGRGSLRRALME